MNLGIALVGAFVAVAAASRGTWSPCGLSMLSTLTPLGERSRGRSFRAAAAWFIAGALAGGICLGGALAALAAVAGAARPSTIVIAAAAGAAGLLALGSDWGVVPAALPVHRRQVNERWLDHYRTWVYGAGFGWQIGTGFATYITSAGVYLLAALAVLSGSPWIALGLGAVHGAVRGAAVLLSARVREPADLLRLHRRVEELAPRARCAVLLSESATIAVALAGLGLMPVVPIVVGLILAAATVATTLSRPALRRLRAAFDRR
jgi:hypothetical protein